MYVNMPTNGTTKASRLATRKEAQRFLMGYGTTEGQFKQRGVRQKLRDLIALQRRTGNFKEGHMLKLPQTQFLRKSLENEQPKHERTAYWSKKLGKKT